VSVKYFVVSLLADLPSSSATDGDLFFVKENSGWYVWDGIALQMKEVAAGGLSLPIAESDVTGLVTDLSNLATTIASETGRAESVEGGIENDLAAEVSARLVAEGTIVTSVTTEASARAAADTTNATAISGEISRATTAEALLAPKLTPLFTGLATFDQDNLGGIHPQPASLIIENLTPATLVQAQNPGILRFIGQFWDGTQSVQGTLDLSAQWSDGSPTSTGLIVSLQGPAGKSNFIIFRNNNPATSSQNCAAPAFSFVGFYWDGAVSQQETWELIHKFATGSNPTSTLSFNHFGSSGQATLDLTGAGNGGTAFKVQVSTKAVDTNTTDAASTAFVLGQAASATPIVDGTGTVGTSTRYARADHVHPTDTTRAPLASPGLTGTPTAPTATPLTGTTQIASTAYDDAAVAVEKARALAAEALFLPKASPAFTGTLSGPTVAVTKSITSGINAMGNVTGASLSIDLSLGNVITMTLTGNVTSSSFANAVAAAGQEITFIITQDATGGRTFVWPAAIVPTGIAPAPTLTASSVSVFKAVIDGAGKANFIANGPVTVARFLVGSITTSNVSNETLFTPPVIGRYRLTAILSVVTIGAGGSSMTITPTFRGGNALGSASPGLVNSVSVVSNGAISSTFAGTATAPSAMGFLTTLTGTIGTAVYQADVVIEFLGQ